MENTPSEDTSSSLDRRLSKREKRELAKEKKQEELTKSKLHLKAKKAVVALLAILFFGFVGYKVWNWFKTPVSDTGKSSILSVKDDDWMKGNPNAKVTLIEYADFECPACAIYSTEVIGKLASEYGDNLRIVYRHFPLPQHTRALDAAKAAEAAGKQGKFWEMSELLYKNQESWSSGDLKKKLEGYAKELNLNLDQLNADFDSDSTLQSIKDNESEAYTLKISETPTFYVNGKKASINSGYEDLKKAIDKALESGN
jgi:protein-disulfide isomerase